MEDNFFIGVIELQKKKDWKTIVDKYHDHPERNRLLWVFPSEENFGFVARELSQLGCGAVLSVGCGSGLLEWMLHEATGLPVQGIEVDSAWWRSKYAPPTFIPLLFTRAALDRDAVSLLSQSLSRALLFCYFINREAFDSYLQHFSGNVIIIIGPGGHKAVHTDPKPFDDVGEEWTLLSWQEVRNSDDFIAIYKRKIKQLDIFCFILMIST